MRLSILDHGHRGRARLLLSALRGRAPDYLKTLMYRPEFFGRRFGAIAHEALRGTSPWSVGERELFASYTSRLNECPH